MGVFKRGKRYWMDATVNGRRYREALRTKDWREAKKRTTSASKNWEPVPHTPLGTLRRVAHLTFRMR